MFREAAETTLLVSCLIFWIIIGASAFSTLYTAMGASSLIKDAVIGLEVNRYVILVTMMGVLILLGMVLDTVGIMMITVPVFVPIILSLGFDPVWFGVLFIINMEIGFLTPPFGYNLFYLRGVAPKDVTMLDIYRSIVPFVLLMLLALHSLPEDHSAAAGVVILMSPGGNDKLWDCDSAFYLSVIYSSGCANWPNESACPFLASFSALRGGR